MCLHSHRKQYNQRMGEKVSIFSNLYACHDCISYDPITIVLAIQFIKILDRHTWDIGRGARLIRYEGLKAVKSMLLPLVHAICSFVENPILMSLRLHITVDLSHRRERGPHLLAQELCTQSIEGAEYWIHDSLSLKN